MAPREPNLALVSPSGNVETAADRLRADGGDCDQQDDNEECGCKPDFPCADCYISGKREFPE